MSTIGGSTGIEPVRGLPIPRRTSAGERGAGPMQYVVVILGLVVALGALAGIKGAQVSELLQWAEHRQHKDGLPPESVSSARATTQSWGDSLNAVGSVTSVRGVAVSN